MRSAATSGGWSGAPSARDAAEAWGGRAFAPALLLCLALALALRLPGIAAASLWADEVATWTFLQLGWAELVGPIARVEPNPPGHYLLLKAWAGLAGDDAAMLRLPSVLAGALAVVPVALLARRAFGPAAGLAAAALLAVSAIHIHHAQQARGYALLFLAAAVALWLVAPMIAAATRPARRAAATAGFALAALVMLHLHATATIVVAAIFVHAATVLAARWLWERRLAPAAAVALVAAGLLVALGAAWWLRLALGIAADPGSAVSWIARPALADTLGILANLLGGFHLGRLKWLVAALAGAVLLAGLALGLRRRVPEAVGLAAGFGFGIAALHGLSQVAPMLLDRTALALLVLALPLAGFALGALRPRGAGLLLAAALLALGLRGTAMRAASFAAEGFGEDWRGAVAALARQAAPGDLVLVLTAPEIGAVPYHAPDAAARLRLRALVAPGDRLAAEVAARFPRAAALAPAEACGGQAWTLSRETAGEAAAVAHWPPAPAQRFDGVVLRRRALPPC